MRHGMANKKLNRTSEHRKALLKNMLNSLVKYEQIKTTLPMGKVVLICSYFTSEFSIFFKSAFLCSEVLLSFLLAMPCLIR